MPSDAEHADPNDQATEPDADASSAVAGSAVTGSDGAEEAAGAGESKAPAESVEPEAARDPVEPKRRRGPGDDLPDEEFDRVIEALLFASGEALTPLRLADGAACSSPRRARQSIDRLRAEYARSLRAFDILEIAGGFRLYTRPEYQEHVARLDKMRAPDRLSAAALETLAIIAYRQPIIRADIDVIRGVQSGAILRSLLDKKLIRVVGRSDQPGRPLQYGTTKRFLDHFGLASVKDLPRVEELKAP